ncbi:MAG: sulfatase-like hydrolase/transferase [Planctomycetes bacterium]|nr:sulfatase-like hydrolase/transferase [Planctomycetota bacterium]
MSDRPNILLIVADDMRADTIGALGNRHIHTPELDRLCERGFAFRRSFCTTPICTPARAEILTGCTSFANRVPWFGMPIDPALTLLPQAFAGGGYHAIHVGKWHNDGHPRERGYHRTACVYPQDNRNHQPTHGHWMRFAEDGGGESAGHATELFTGRALAEIAAAPADRPWFCYLGHSAPHDPHECPEPFASMYPAGDMPLLPNFMPEHPFDNGDLAIRDELLEDWPRRHDAMRRYRARYHGVISHLDHHVGRLLRRLELDGTLARTVVVFTADQGLAIGSHGLLGKESMYDHSISAPLILAGPGIPAGGRSAALAHHVDLLPTLCALAGIPRPPSAVHGHDLGPLLRGWAERVRDEVLCEFFSPEEPGQPLRHTQRCVRSERWKLTWYPRIRRWQLFDLAADPDELVDLLAPWRCRHRQAVEAGGPVWRKDPWSSRDPVPPLAHAEVVAAACDLHARLLRQMRLHGDPLLALDPPPSPLEG